MCRYRKGVKNVLGLGANAPALSRAVWVSALCGLSWIAASANPVNIQYLEGQLPVAPDAITAYGPDLFGDKINLFNGSLVFEHTDSSLPGNNALPVALARRHTPGQDLSVRGQFGDWDMDTPRIGGSFSTISGWVTAPSTGGRCSGGLMPPTVSSGAGTRTLLGQPADKTTPFTVTPVPRIRQSPQCRLKTRWCPPTRTAPSSVS
jgi:hypothetical protein